MISIEATGKTVKQAIEDGLKKLDKTIDEVEVKIITQPGIFKKAKVMITVEGAEPPKTVVEKPAVQLKPAIQSKNVNTINTRLQEPFKNGKEEKHSAATNQPFRQQKHEANRQPTAAANQQSPAASHKLPTTDHQLQKKNFKEREYQEITEEAVKKASNFAEKLLKVIDPDCSISNNVKNGELIVSASSGGGAIIGYKGETLDAIEYLTLLTVSRGDNHYKIKVDCNDYRIKRHEMLVSKAKHLADKAIKTGRKVALESMNNQSRKIIHAALACNENVITKSEGNDPHRHIVIIPKRKNGGR